MPGDIDTDSYEFSLNLWISIFSSANKPPFTYGNAAKASSIYGSLSSGFVSRTLNKSINPLRTSFSIGCSLRCSWQPPAGYIRRLHRSASAHQRHTPKCGHRPCKGRLPCLIRYNITERNFYSLTMHPHRCIFTHPS